MREGKKKEGETRVEEGKLTRSEEKGNGKGKGEKNKVT